MEKSLQSLLFAATAMAYSQIAVKADPATLSSPEPASAESQTLKSIPYPAQKTLSQHPQAFPTLVFIFGFLLNEPSPEYRAALTLQKSFARQGRQVLIIGDGITPVTRQEIVEALKDHHEPLDIVIAAHGMNFGKAQKNEKAYLANEYVLSFDSGEPNKTDQGHYSVFENGQEIIISNRYLVRAEAIFKAMPYSTRGVYLIACGSEEALQYAHLLPRGAYFFPTSRIGSGTGLTNAFLALISLTRPCLQSCIA